MATPPFDRSEDGRAGLGDLLRRAREGRGLTLEQIANETKIPQRHLEAFEHDNLSAVPGEFYQRAQIRAYARAVHLDQPLALAQLEHALQGSVIPDAMPETSSRQKPTFFTKRMLILIVVLALGAVFERMTRELQRGFGRDDHAGTELNSPQYRVPPVRQIVPDTVLLPSTPSDGVRSNGLSTITEQAGARASADSVTELVVTTEPPGARVTVNGIGWGTTPVAIRYLPPGDKRIRVSKDGYATEERVEHLAEGQPRTVDILLRSTP